VSDDRLRKLERRWKETGAPDDGAAYLRERMRAGELSQDRVRWAAACGHEPALRAVDGPAPSADLAALQAELTGAHVQARFWVAVVRAGWTELGDDRVLAYVWNWERQLVGLRAYALSQLDYATPASDVLGNVEQYTRFALERLRSEDPFLPEPLRGEPGQALKALCAHVAPEAIRAVLLRDWAPWLLGADDPVATRVAEQSTPPRGHGFALSERAP
jgi:hypothetical protein